MKYLILTIILISCATVQPKHRAMANCTHTKDNYFICDEIPEQVTGKSNLTLPVANPGHVI
jgi:hypothetical protein